MLEHPALSFFHFARPAGGADAPTFFFRFTSAGSSGREKKKLKTFINDKGEEVTMEVEEETKPQAQAKRSPDRKPPKPKASPGKKENTNPNPKSKTGKGPAKKQMGIASFFARK